jgi:ABC-type long-subunit fatty acid transport system fused permease/ATPase subunit
MFLNRIPQTYMPLLWPLGRSPPLSFYNAVVWVLYASQISLYLATTAFATGAVYGAAGDVAMHLHLMVSGLYLFYFSAMYIQLPGFINAAPSRPPPRFS